MASISQFALMAGGAYISTRPDPNKFPIPEGWTELTALRVKVDSSGFEATTFRNDTTGELVISFAGTSDWRDWVANFGLGSGASSDQLRQAAAYYMTVLATVGGNDPNANISFTGHSLGGGIASLMAVFFNKKAVTFDQAPFAASATTAVRDDLVSYLTSHGYSNTDLNTLAPGLNSFSSVGQRANNVNGINVAGEVLSLKVVELLLSRIGGQVMLQHGNTDLSLTIDLHSQALLSAFWLNDGFRKVTFKLTDLLPMLFDSNLYAKSTSSTTENLLERLIRHQTGNAPGVTTADQMLDRFTADLQKVAVTSGLAAAGDLTKALIAFAMQMYYSGPNATDAQKQLYTLVGGGIQFDRGDIAGSLGDMKGYNLYFISYLATLPTEVRAIANTMLGELHDWYLAGTRLIATAGTKTAFMLGAGNTDSLTGGSLNDLLVGLGGTDILAGGAGADTLIGGTGADYLLGGAGSDTYVVTNGDTLIDATDDGFGGDGQGQIDWGGLNPAGSYDQQPDSVTKWGNTDWTFEFVGERETGGLLTIVKGGERITVAGFKSGMYGIALNAPTAATPLPPNTAAPIDATSIYNNTEHPYYNQRDAARMELAVAGADAEAWGNGKLVGDDNANYLHDGSLDGDDELVGNGGRDALVADFGNDRLDGGTGDDALTGGHGDDRLVGGDGMDILSGGEGRDVLLGGIGDDVLLGAGDLQPAGADWRIERDPATGAWTLAYQFFGYDVVAGDGADYLDGGDGRDLIEGGLGNDQLMGGAGKDRLTGGSENDMLDGGADDDVLFGDGWRDNNPAGYWLAESHGDDYLQGGGGNDSLWGGDGNDILAGDEGFAVYAFRLIDGHSGRRYCLGTHPQTRGHAGKQSPITREARPGISLPVVLLSPETEVMDQAARNGTTKVSRGGTPSNETWRVAA